MSRKTSLNLIVDKDDSTQFTVLVNAELEYHSDGMPLELYCNILTAVCDTVDEWNQSHNPKSDKSRSDADKRFRENLRTSFTDVQDALPETNKVGKCLRRLLVVTMDDSVAKRLKAWYSCGRFYSCPDFYSEYEIKNVIAWRYND